MLHMISLVNVIRYVRIMAGERVHLHHLSVLCFMDLILAASSVILDFLLDIDPVDLVLVILLSTSVSLPTDRQNY